MIKEKACRIFKKFQYFILCLLLCCIVFSSCSSSTPNPGEKPKTEVEKLLAEIERTMVIDLKTRKYTHEITPKIKQAIEKGYITTEMINDIAIKKINRMLEPLDIEKARIEVLKLVNIEREKEGLKSVVYRNKLEDYANIRAEEITQKFAHSRPNNSDFSTGIFEYQTCGENIAAGQYTAKEVMEAWMNSPGHRANILNPDFKELAVGITVKDDGYGVYWVQLFFSQRY